LNLDDLEAVFELLEGWGLNPQLFFQSLNTLSNYVLGGVSYVLYMHWLYITILVGFQPSKSSVPQLFFHNSNTAFKVSNATGTVEAVGRLPQRRALPTITSFRCS